MPAGLLLSSGTVALLSLLGDEAFLSWGWRVAFLISGVLVVVGLYIRLKVLETPAFAKLKEERAEAKVPFLDLLRSHPKNIMLGLGARFIEGVTFNTFGVFSIAYITTALGLPRQVALMAVIISSALMIVMLPIFGTLSDRYGRRRVFALGSLGIGLLVFPSFWLMNLKSPELIWLAVAIPFAFVYPAVYGPQAALFAELFDTRVRYSGVSFVYQFSGIFASGLTPIIATELLRAGDSTPWLFCGYVVIVSIISALSVFAMRETHQRDMAVDDTHHRASGAAARTGLQAGRK